MVVSRTSEGGWEELVRQCCEKNCEESFNRFREMSHESLVAALVRFCHDWRVVEEACATTYAEYRHLLDKTFDVALDYRNYFYALGFFHLLRHYGSNSLCALASRMLGQVVLPVVGKSQVLGIFSVALRLSPRCRFYFFEVCFTDVHLGYQLALEQQCQESVRRVVSSVFG